MQTMHGTKRHDAITVNARFRFHDGNINDDRLHEETSNHQAIWRCVGEAPVVVHVSVKFPPDNHALSAPQKTACAIGHARLARIWETRIGPGFQQ